MNKERRPLATCDDCRFFGGAAGPDMDGECRRYPPVLYVVPAPQEDMTAFGDQGGLGRPFEWPYEHIRSAFPITQDEQLVCGEFSSEPRPKAIV